MSEVPLHRVAMENLHTASAHGQVSVDGGFRRGERESERARERETEKDREQVTRHRRRARSRSTASTLNPKPCTQKSKP